MGVIPTPDNQIKLENLYLDFELKATKIKGNCTDFSGAFYTDSNGIQRNYTIGMYTEQKGFGITNIELDIQPNLQPIVTITFKDLYGNLVFGRDKDFNLDILFQLPYPKFQLNIRGYVGNPVSYLLQVKKTTTTYVPTDGSYEIKAEFVPNIFGFFNDIPFQFLFAVPKLKIAMKDVSENSEDNTSIAQIAKIGSDIKTKIQAAEDQYSEIKKLLLLLQSGGDALNTAYNDGSLPKDETTKKINPIKSPDENLTKQGFQDINFNFDYNISVPANETNALAPYTGTIGDGIKLSIRNKITIGPQGWATTIENLKKQQTWNDVNSIIDNNLKAISDAAIKQAGREVEEELINSQTIRNVMTRLAGDCAYILGYILEGGLIGNNLDPSRETDNTLIGNYYPLTDQGGNGGTTSGSSVSITGQVPAPIGRTGKEQDYVRVFLKAFYEGTQEAKAIQEQVQQQEGGMDGSMAMGAQLKKRLTNIEIGKPNPYSNGSNSERDIVNILQRCGLMGTRMCGYLKDDGTIDYNQNRTKIIDSEWENLSDTVNAYRGLESKNIKKFASIIKELYDQNGNIKTGINFNNKTKYEPNLTYQQYFENYFGQMTGAVFKNNSKSSLICTEFINNGVYYYNEKQMSDLLILKGRDDTTTLFGGIGHTAAVNCWMYIEKDALEATSAGVSDQGFVMKLIAGDQDVTKGYDSSFYEFTKIDEDTDFIDGSGENVFIDFVKLRQGKKPNSLNELILYRYKESIPNDTKTKKFEQGDLGALYAQTVGADTQLKDYVLDLRDPLMGKFLFDLSTKILENLTETDAQKDKRKAEEEASKNGLTTVKTNEPYDEDINQFNTVYTQFHHICNSWLSLASTTKSFDCSQSLQISGLRNLIENKYKVATINSEEPSAEFSLNFSFPLLTSDNSFDVSQSIINTSPLIDDNSQTSVLNMMTNICTLNNFLFLSIPGGVSSTNENIFLPAPNNLNNALGKNQFSIIWTPTPESRITNNDGSDVYPIANFRRSLDTIIKPISLFEFGKTNNIIVKSIKAGTDDNKVTAESIQASNDIVNNQNQNKKKGFDCSMLSVMQGRSYKIGIDVIGNAQLYPTQLVAVQGLPLFTGLYQVMKVRHTLTPNNMDTSIEAMKIKYNGRNFVAVYPLTTKDFTGKDSNNNGNTNNTNEGSNSNESITGSDDLNTALLTRLKDVKLKNSSEINNLIKQLTSSKYSDFPTWFNKELVGKTFFGNNINASKWTKLWDSIIPIEWPNYGSSGINFLEFLCINTIIYGETGGVMGNVSEKMNSVTKESSPGIAYAFDAISGLKSSYNKASNITAGVLFNDPDYIAAHGSLKFGNDSRVLRSSNPKWNSNKFPLELFPTDRTQAVSTDPTFISEADFFKFRGRGYIQTTWRAAYEEILKKILSYSGTDPVIIRYKNLWNQSPYNGNRKTILTRSTNEQWNDLFENSLEIRNIAMKTHADGADSYQYITDLTESKERLIIKINKFPRKINGAQADKPYSVQFRNRVYVQLDTLYPAGKTNTSLNNTNSNSGNGNPVYEKDSPANAVWDKSTEEKIKTLHPKIRNNAREFINKCYEQGIKIRITQGLRTFAEQNELYAKGRTAPGSKVTNAKGGESNHNFGLAFDIIFIDNNGKGYYEGGYWNNMTPIVNIANQYGFSWGGSWKTFKDLPHFENQFGLSLRQIQNRYNSGQVKDGYIII